MERYQQEDGRYVLYLDGVRAYSTDVVSLLIDAWTGRVITHGEPRSVRREYDGLRAIAAPADGLLLLEGRPALATLNRALEGNLQLHELHLAFTRFTALRLAEALFQRLGQRPLT